MPNRREHVLQLAAASLAGGDALGAGFARAAAPVERVDGRNAAPADADTACQTWARLNADLSGRTVFSVTLGAVWGFEPQSDSVGVDAFGRRFYGYSALTARKIIKREGGGLSVRTKSWAFYRDPDTDAVVEQIHNPYTGATNACPPLSGPTSEQVVGAVANRTVPYPVQVKASSIPYDLRIRRLGPHAFVTTSSFVRLKPGNISWWKLEGETWSYACHAADLDDPAQTHVPSTWSQNLVAEWQTWTGMHGRPGHILFKGEGSALRDHREAPPDLAGAVARHFPGDIDRVLAWEG